MMLRDGLMLFHGSYTVVDHIDLDRCRRGKDFGRGFYLTTAVDQARSFIRSSRKKAYDQKRVSSPDGGGYVSSFVFHAPDFSLPVFEFDTADEVWLWFIARNRRGSLASELDSRLPAELFDAEIVVGKIANDTTNRVITAYLEGLFGPVDAESAIQIAIGQLMPERLHDQLCFLTRRSLSCLEFVGAERYA